MAGTHGERSAEELGMTSDAVSRTALHVLTEGRLLHSVCWLTALEPGGSKR
ncbi:hypothetical protein DB31_5301 [Hyalangium minutum]|uniref:Uncharacterized protein n=1 Tax=Hyalangium minutum TaxID=394096 RepID=A0A085WRE6_9BACT|nr:hypothetical protein DB31_5301 [Hyalangium minutum]